MTADPRLNIYNIYLYHVSKTKDFFYEGSSISSYIEIKSKNEILLFETFCIYLA